VGRSFQARLKLALLNIFLAVVAQFHALASLNIVSFGRRLSPIDKCEILTCELEAVRLKCRLSNAKGGEANMKVLLQSTCDMYQDKKQRYIDLMTEAVRLAEKEGMKLLGAWHSVIGFADQITNLWGYESEQSWAQAKQNLEQNPRWQELWAEIRPCVRYETTALLTPVSYSPDYAADYQYPSYNGGLWLQSTINVWPDRLQQFYELMAQYVPRAGKLGMVLVGGYIAIIGNAFEITDYWHYADENTFSRYWVRPYLGSADDEYSLVKADTPGIRINQDHEVYKVLRPLLHSQSH